MLNTAGSVDLSNSLRLAIGRLARRIRQHSQGGLTPSQRSVIASLDRNGPMTMSDLAEVESISAPSATGIVSRLVDRGLIERLPHPEDRRCSVVSLSEQGKTHLQALRDEGSAFLAGRLETLDEHELRLLRDATELLHRLVDGE